jgi:hypothetical protein
MRQRNRRCIRKADFVVYSCWLVSKEPAAYVRSISGELLGISA